MGSHSLQAGGTFVKANPTRVFPASGVRSTFGLTLPQGLNRVLAVASRTPAIWRKSHFKA
ncbi:DUF4384 domain-containing protein [Deinococcus hohokamensis]|uniref:DUF4384 domain-containing protein n=1 Tax=Deinococcus hohokamensis TaxID=309883 RepID=A0ABV9IDG2_9DEIO